MGVAGVWPLDGGATPLEEDHQGGESEQGGEGAEAELEVMKVMFLLMKYLRLKAVSRPRRPTASAFFFMTACSCPRAA
jgi:hypothetical protein